MLKQTSNFKIAPSESVTEKISLLMEVFFHFRLKVPFFF